MTPEHKALAEAVAAQLQLNPAPGYDDLWTPVFVMPDGGKLLFSDGRAHGQLHISTSLPNTLHDHRSYYRAGEAPKTSINVSDTKPADRIAADIRRRFLPEHAREVAECQANKARHDENNAKRILALTKVAAPLGEHVRCDERTGEPRPLARLSLRGFTSAACAPADFPRRRECPSLLNGGNLRSPRPCICRFRKGSTEPSSLGGPFQW